VNEGKAGFRNNEHTWQSGPNKGKLEPETPAAQPPKCPECTSQKVWKDGLRRSRNGDVQRWLCRTCGYRFSEPKVNVNVTSEFGETSHSGKNVSNLTIGTSNLPIEKQLDGLSFGGCENVASHGASPLFTNVAKPLKAFPCYNSKCRVCVSESEAKNLAEVETQQSRPMREGTIKPENFATLKGEIISFLIYLKNQQYPETTIKTYGRILENFLRKGVDLSNIDAVKESVANEKSSTNTKVSKLCVYGRFLKWKGITWEKPRLGREETDPFLPQISEVEQLISGSGWKLKSFLQLIWECALRSVEANELPWEDLDTVNRTVRIRPRKRGKPRTLRISEKCLQMIMRLPHTSAKVFGKSLLNNKRACFELTRKRLARQLANPRLEKIHFHSLRHLRATIWYHSGVDLKTLQERLGHKNIIHTFRYVHLAEAMFPETTDQYYTRVTSTIKEGEHLVQQGFELVGRDESGCLWRKRKTFEDIAKEREQQNSGVKS